MPPKYVEGSNTLTVNARKPLIHLNLKNQKNWSDENKFALNIVFLFQAKTLY